MSQEVLTYKDKKTLFTSSHILTTQHTILVKTKVCNQGENRGSIETFMIEMLRSLTGSERTTLPF